MENKEFLLTVLKEIKSVDSHYWKTVMALVESIKSGDTLVLEKKWDNDYKNDNRFYPLDLDKIETWSTYDYSWAIQKHEACIQLEFFYKDKNNIECYVVIFEGTNMLGIRRDKRFTAHLLLKIDFILHLNDMIDNKYNDLLERRYEKHLQIQKNEWIENERMKIFKTK